MIRKTLLTLGFVCSALVPASFAAAMAGDVSPDAPLVAIDGNKLTLADLERMHPSALFHARNTFYEGQKKVVLSFVDDYLLQREAQKENLTVEQLLDRHVNSTIAKDPSEEALRVYYEGVDTTEPYEKVREQIVGHLREVRIAKAKAAYMASLRQNAKIELLISPPRAEVAVKEIPVRGDAHAPVTIVEYADYECPYCQVAEPILQKVLAENQGKVDLIYKDVPLPMHAHAQKASEAALCAGDQGKFWEYHDHLYATKQFELQQLKAGARQLKLDGESFDKCLDAGDHAEKVKGTLKEGQQFGLEGTPSFFVNGRFVSGNLSAEDWRKMIDAEVTAAAARSKSTASR
ncbi:MAG TPA: DsbA family protein [Bryobacteraceae bacterium]|nr:DsbA family protein [Bryobacteraceae bacterium]